MTVIVMPLVLFVYYYAKFILTLWMGAEYAGISVEILRIMLIGYIFNCYSQISFANIQAFGKSKIHCIHPYDGIYSLFDNVIYNFKGIWGYWCCVVMDNSSNN